MAWGWDYWAIYRTQKIILLVIDHFQVPVCYLLFWFACHQRCCWYQVCHSSTTIPLSSYYNDIDLTGAMGTMAHTCKLTMGVLSHPPQCWQVTWQWMMNDRTSSALHSLKWLTHTAWFYMVPHVFCGTMQIAHMWGIITCIYVKIYVSITPRLLHTDSPRSVNERP